MIGGTRKRDGKQGIEQGKGRAHQQAHKPVRNTKFGLDRLNQTGQQIAVAIIDQRNAKQQGQDDPFVRQALG